MGKPEYSSSHAFGNRANVAELPYFATGGFDE